MSTKVRFTLVLLALAAASLACSLPLFDEAPAPIIIPSATDQAVVQAPSATYTQVTPVSSPTPFPTLTPLPTHTASPVPTLTFTAGPTSTATINPAYSPTPPPTITVAAAAKTSTAVASNRVTWVAPYFTPNLDGDWGEWKGVTSEYPAGALVYGSSNWTGEADLNASFHVAWDASYLYIAAKVKDDVYIQNASGSNLYLGDSLEILFDANYLGDFYSNQLSPDDYQLGISAGQGDTSGAREAYLWFPRGVQGGRQVGIAAVQSDGVYRVEAAIPWSVFGVTPASGQRYGFALSVSDNDTAGANQQDSMVSSAGGRVLVAPTTWGELRLK